MEPISNEKWVEGKMTALHRGDAQWQPDTAASLARLRALGAKNDHAVPRSRPAMWAAGTAVALGGAVAIGTLHPAGRSVAEYCWQCLSGATVTHVAQGARTAPEFVLPDSAGREIRLSAYKGNVVLLNFWATWCPACGEELPCFSKLARRYEASGFRAVGVSVDEGGWAKVRPFLEKHGVTFPVALDNGGAVSGAYRVEALPITFLIGRDGNIASVHRGVTDADELEREVRQLLAAR